MSMEPTCVTAADDLQRRVLVLGRAALEGSRPLSDLLGEAVAELRASLSTMHSLEEELERANGQISALQRELEVARRAPSPLEPERVSRMSPPSHDGAAADRVSHDGATGGAFRREMVDLFEPGVPDAIPLLEDSLRSRFSAALYLGTLVTGDRLPSIRDLCRRTGLNHKVVRRVYRALESEGVVEVRDRSGIFLSENDSAGTLPLQGRDEWVAGLLADAVQRDVSAGDLVALLQRSLADRTLRAACVDGTADDRFGLCSEIHGRLGLSCTPVDPADAELARHLREADVVVTTPFHAEEVRRRLRNGQPLVVARLHPAWRDFVAHHGDSGPVWLVCVDRSAGERIRDSFGPKLASALRVVTADELPAAEVLRGSALATLAALDRLNGVRLPGSIAAPRYLAPDTVLRLARVTVELNRARREPAMGALRVAG
jgi:DNA-binding transcriptional regulator YhcF (GntR family)